MTNVKKGDLAITTYAITPGNSGRIVKVLRRKYNSYDGVRWWIESVGTPMKANGLGMQMVGHFPDAYLRPISGLPDTEDTDIEQPIKEVA